MALRHVKLEIDIASVTFLYEPFYAVLPPAPWSGRTVESIFGAGVEIC
jgi:hypothetical protein